LKENGVEEGMANDIAGIGLVPITERYAIRIARKTYEADNTCSTRGRAWKILLPLKTKRRLLYLKIQSVPRSKHFSSRL